MKKTWLWAILPFVAIITSIGIFLSNVLNSLLYILITGCRWCDLPRGSISASKSASHRWLKRWYSDGTFEHLQARILAHANEKGLINWDFGAIVGSFSPWERRR